LLANGAKQEPDDAPCPRNEVLGDDPDPTIAAGDRSVLRAHRQGQPEQGLAAVARRDSETNPE
jgi:hypothetical protein